MDISIRQGETLQLPITADDSSALAAQFRVFKNNVVFIDETEAFIDVDGKQSATIFTNDTNLPVDSYEYSLTIEYSDGVISIFPDSNACDDDCSFPRFIVCEGNPEEMVS